MAATAIAVMLAVGCGRIDVRETFDEKIDFDTLSDSFDVLELKNPYDTLSVATYITKIEDTYFIEDCYHDQIIYNDNLTDSLGDWNVLTNEIHYGHTLAYDGTCILIDDTENNRLLTFQKIDGKYVHTQTLENIGTRPHYIQYDEENKCFMAWSSVTGEMYILKRSDKATDDGIYPIYIDGIYGLDELNGVYVRSFTLMDDGIYFVSGPTNAKIIRAVIDEKEKCLRIEAQYDVPPEIAGMVQITKIEDYYYITVSTDNQGNQDYATIIRTDSLENLAAGGYEDIYSQLGISGGTPYYITKIEGRYYMAHHRTAENIIAFDVNDNVIENVEVLY
jgi:hypothetical protein